MQQLKWERYDNQTDTESTIIVNHWWHGKHSPATLETPAEYPKLMLPLTLTNKWFDLIKSGVKLEEYREIKSYWFSRLVLRPLDVVKYVGVRDAKVNEDIVRLCNDAFWSKTFGFKPFDFIDFTNGYAKNAPRMRVECKGIEINTGKKEWGAVEGQKYFVIKLGSVTA